MKNRPYRTILLDDNQIHMAHGRQRKTACGLECEGEVLSDETHGPNPFCVPCAKAIVSVIGDGSEIPRIQIEGLEPAKEQTPF